MKYTKNQILFCFLALLTFGCGSKKNQEKTLEGKINIVTTTGMIEDAVKNIVKDSASVSALMGPGVDPHLYKATQGDLIKLSKADLIFYNGLFLEGKMGEIFKKLGRTKPVIAAAENIDKDHLRASPTYQDAYDPHVWFDVGLWKGAVENISQSLQRINPEKANFYKVNTSAYLKRLDSLHQAVKLEIIKIPKAQRVLITAHDAFGYFGDAYGVEVRGLQGISTLSEFGLKDISDLVKFIVDRKIKAVFVETSVSTKAVDAVVIGCKERGFEVVIGGSLYSDAMGESGTVEGTYIGMVNANVQTIVNALK